MKEKLIKIKLVMNYLTDFAWIFILIISALILLQALLVFDNFNYLFVLLPIIPILVSALFKIIFQKYNWSFIVRLIIKIIGCILAVIFLLFIEFGILFTMPFTTSEPSIKQYKNSIVALQKLYKKSDLSYFPDKIPQDATNYYFFVGTSFQGYDTYYLRFNAGETYLNDLIEKYRNDFSIIGKKNELYNKRLSIDINEIEDNDIIYLLKQRNSKDCDNCKFGFTINENDNRVCFFFQNY